MYTKAILLASVFLACHAATAKVSMVKVYSGKIPTGNGYTIKLEIPKDWDDPGAYTKVTLYQKGKSVFSLNELQASDLKNVDNFPENTKNIGKYLKTFPLSFKSRSQHVLAMSNWMGGSSDDELILVSLFNHTPKVIFQKSVKVLFIKDFDGDGYYDILKAGGRGEPNGNNNYSYDPYLVYRQVQNGDDVTFKINESLSKKWSSERNFYWHGIKYDEKIRVDKIGELVLKK